MIAPNGFHPVTKYDYNRLASHAVYEHVTNYFPNNAMTFSNTSEPDYKLYASGFFIYDMLQMK